jgi:hypothetical protein
MVGHQFIRWVLNLIADHFLYFNIVVTKHLMEIKCILSQKGQVWYMKILQNASKFESIFLNFLS